MTMQREASPPPLSHTLTGLPRALHESMSLFTGLERLIRECSGGDGHPVLVLPGYGAADGSTIMLRYFLRRIGYQPHALELGRNVEGQADRIRSVDDATRFREQMTAPIVKRVREIQKQSGKTVSLVGWSMGGLYALDTAQQIPKSIRQVITLGSPFGDPRGTSLFKVMRQLSGSTVPIEQQDFTSWLNKSAAPKVPTRVIYSERDGIVGTAIARLPTSKNIEYEQVDSSHIAFALNPRALRSVAMGLRANTPAQ